MINTSRNEQAAMVKGGQAGGRFLEQIGKTDLAILSHRPFILPMSGKRGKFTICGIPTSDEKSPSGG